MVVPGLRGSNGQPAAPPYSNGPYTSDQQVSYRGISINATEYSASGAINSQDSFVELESSGAALAMTIAAPNAGRFLVITHKDVSTSAHNVRLTSGTFDGTNASAAFNAQNETLVLFGVSNTRFVIVENIGSVALS